MVKVFYNGYPQSKTNAWLGGKLFIEGVCEFKNKEEGLKFASMFYLKYEVIEEKQKKVAKTKAKKVNAND